MSLFVLCLSLFNSEARNGNLVGSLFSDITLASCVAQALPKSNKIGIKSKAFLPCLTQCNNNNNNNNNNHNNNNNNNNNNDNFIISIA